jgi:hypothetical protein
MTEGPVIWSTALVSSLAAHVAAAAVLIWATKPDDVPVQQAPTTEMQLAAYQVQRSEAQETQPESQNATSVDKSGTPVAQDAVATTRSEPQPFDSDRIFPNTDAGDKVAVAPPPNVAAEPVRPTQQITKSLHAAGISLTEASAPTTQLSADAPLPQQAVSLAAPAQPISNVQPMAAVARIIQDTVPTVRAERTAGDIVAPIVNAAFSVEAALPKSMTVPTAPVESEDLASQVPDIAPSASSALPATSLGESAATSQTAASVAPPVSRSKASLAFSAGGDEPVDPVSLTAFQSFMSPDDLGQQAAEVRDSISSTLSSVPCSRIQVRYDPDENTLVMSGHVPEAGLRGTVLAAMQEKMGVDIPVRGDLLVLPRPQCGALAGISQVGLPQSTDQITNPLLVGENTHAREFAYVEDQPLVLDLQGADYDAFVYVDFFDAGGNVLHLMPNEFTPMQRTDAKGSLKIGSDRALAQGEPGLYIKIGPPFGQEIAVAFAASEPLYEGVRPLIEPAEPYLDWLRARVTEVRDLNPDFKGEWVYFFVSTSSK